MKHWDTHPQYVEGCFACRITSVSVSSAAMPSRRPIAHEKVQMERRWDKDMPAYKRLREDGVQPRGIDGCATLERHAEHKTQIELGSLVASPKQIKEAETISRDFGVMA
jgi:hypothetical protein